MASSPDSDRLTPLQRSVLAAFFAREHGFFLTGGAALAGFHLCHRTTDDLDLFTQDDAAFSRARHVLSDIAATIGGTLHIVQDAPGFIRTVLTKQSEAVVIDFVRERTYQIHPAKPVIDGIAVDPPDEIFANKLTTLVGRAEERDLVDVMLLERSGLRVEDALQAALEKDGGCTPATLAWILSEVSIPDGIRLPAGVKPEELRAWLDALVIRLRRAALPTT